MGRFQVSFINLYGQVVIDEFAPLGELVPGVDSNALPWWVRFHGGREGGDRYLPLGKGMLMGSFKWAKTDPYLYLRDNGTYTQAPCDFGVNFMVRRSECSIYDSWHARQADSMDHG